MTGSTDDIEPSQNQAPPDYRIGNVLLYVSQYYDLSLRTGLDAPSKRALSSLAHESYRAIAIRGARLGALVDAIQKVRGDRRVLEQMPIVDFKVATVAGWVAKRHDEARSLGICFELFERLRLLTDAVHEAITLRGATVEQLLAALRDVRPHGSIAADLPSLQAKLRAENPE
jgi:hypothetical protein